jgi:hypothetical protein
MTDEVSYRFFCAQGGKMKKWLISLALAVLFAGIAVAAPGDSFDTVAPPSAGRAQIVIYRIKGAGALKIYLFDATDALAAGTVELRTDRTDLKINLPEGYTASKNLGMLKSGEYVVLDVAPGKYTFFISQPPEKVNHVGWTAGQMGESDKVTQFEVKAGERQYGRIVFAFGGHPWLTPVTEEKAGASMGKYKESALLKED